MFSEAEAEVSPAAAAPSAPSAAAPSSAGKTSPLAAATALNAAAAFAAPTPSARTVSAARMTASALSADQDPLATLVLPRSTRSPLDDHARGEQAQDGVPPLRPTRDPPEPVQGRVRV